jgi:hypothetical protein
MQVAKEMVLSAHRLEEILRIRIPVIFGSLLCKPELDIGEKLLPYIEEALKIEKGRKSSKFFSDRVGIVLSAAGAREVNTAIGGAQAGGDIGRRGFLAPREVGKGPNMLTHDGEIK